MKTIHSFAGKSTIAQFVIAAVSLVNSFAQQTFGPAIGPVANPPAPSTDPAQPPITIPAAPAGWTVPAPAPSVFQWSRDPDGMIYARVSPDVYDRLLRSGLDVNGGSTASTPQVMQTAPGARVLNLGGERYEFDGSNGFTEEGGAVIYVLRFTRAPAGTPNFGGSGSTTPEVPATSNNPPATASTTSIPIELSGAWESTHGNVMLNTSNGTITGTWDAGDGKTGEFLSGTFDPATGNFSLEYFQPWDGARGTANFNPTKDWNGYRGGYAGVGGGLGPWNLWR